jgi:hypothetical protein
MLTCPTCGTVMNGHVSTHKKPRNPRRGDFGLCSSCGEVFRLEGAALTPRKALISEMTEQMVYAQMIVRIDLATALDQPPDHPLGGLPAVLPEPS